MANLNLSADQVLTTTRAVRKRLDFKRPVEMSVIKECLEIALQAPMGSNNARIRFVVVTDADKRRALAELYQRFFREYREEFYPTTSSRKQFWTSTDHLAEHFHEVPVMIIPTWPRQRRLTKMPDYSPGSSVYPPIWSYMLAARERGLGTCLTTGHLIYEREAANLLGIPYDDVAQYCLIPTAYTIGTDFKPTKRPSVEEFIQLDGWQS
jgi:nitroreductase